MLYCTFFLAMSSIANGLLNKRLVKCILLLERFMKQGVTHCRNPLVAITLHMRTGVGIRQAWTAVSAFLNVISMASPILAKTVFCKII